MKAVELTLGGLCRVPEGTGEVVRLPERGAEVSRGHSRPRKRAGTLDKQCRKTHLAEGLNGPREGINGVASRPCDS